VGYATTMMKKTGPSHAVGYKSSKKQGRYSLERNQCVCADAKSVPETTKAKNVSATFVMAPASGLSRATVFKASADMPGIPFQVRSRSDGTNAEGERSGRPQSEKSGR